MENPKLVCACFQQSRVNPDDAPELTPSLGDLWLNTRALRLSPHNHDFVNIREGLACLSEVSAAKR